MASGHALAGFGQGNVGFSGTPMWKIRQQGLAAQAQVPLPPTKEEEERERQLKELQVAHVLADAASTGGPIASPKDKVQQKPIVRHILVKDLRKLAATSSKLSLPTTGLFENRAPVALFALFDGQSCANAAAPGPEAADWCVRHLHTKLIQNLVTLPPHLVNQTLLKAILIKTFEDLDRDLLVTQPSIMDGCGAALALMVGNHLLTAVLGKCNALLCQPLANGGATSSRKGTGKRTDDTEMLQARSLGSNQGRCNLPGEIAWLQQQGGVVGEAPGSGSFVRDPAGNQAFVSRTLGDRAWKGDESVGVPRMLRSVPEINAVQISYDAGNPVLVLTGAPVTDVPAQTLADAVAAFPLKPRAASGSMAALAAESLAKRSGADGAGHRQCAAVTVCLLPPRTQSTGSGEAGPPAKKLKAGPATDQVQSVRLRHILVRYKDCGQPHDPVRNKPVVRSQAEAEASLRGALGELLQEQRSDPKSKATIADAKKAAMAAVTPTPKFLDLCKKLSECTSSKKGGGVCGDIGWVGGKELSSFGATFGDAVRGLQVFQWSDIVPSQQGVHILQRIA